MSMQSGACSPTPPRARGSRPRLVAVAGLSAALLLTGCSGSGSANPTGTPSSASSGTPSSATSRTSTSTGSGTGSTTPVDTAAAHAIAVANDRLTDALRHLATSLRTLDKAGGLAPLRKDLATALKKLQSAVKSERDSAYHGVRNCTDVATYYHAAEAAYPGVESARGNLLAEIGVLKDDVSLVGAQRSSVAKRGAALQAALKGVSQHPHVIDARSVAAALTNSANIVSDSKHVIKVASASAASVAAGAAKAIGQARQIIGKAC